MLVTDRHATGGRDLVEVVAAAVAGGVGLVQVREPDLDPVALAALVRRLRARLDGTAAGLLVNGAAPLARATGLGLHLPAAAPALEGPPPRPYGRAVHDEREAARARAEGPDYVVVGAVFPTPSKPGHPGIGLARLAALAAALSPVPVFAVGGLTPERVLPVLAAGAHGAAVRSAILGAPDPAAAAAAFAARLVRPAA